MQALQRAAWPQEILQCKHVVPALQLVARGHRASVNLQTVEMVDHEPLQARFA